MSASVISHYWRPGERDEEGHRTYKLVSRVRCTSVDDGPATVLACQGLPQPGAIWAVGNDTDSWAWCRPTATATPMSGKESNLEWEVEQTFSTKPLPPNQQRCNNTPIEDPLLEPPKISGSFAKYTEEATIDRFGLPIVNSCHEPLQGPQVEFDANRTSIVIEQPGVLDLQLPLIDAMKNTLNDATMWGCPRRCIKLSEVTWERRFYGQCFAYYMRRFTFDVHIVTDPLTGVQTSGFDRDIADKGTRMLKGHWNINSNGSGDYIIDKIGGVIQPDPSNPAHFIDACGPDNKKQAIPLNGQGLPAGVNVRSGCSLYMCISIVVGGGVNAYNLGDNAKWIRLATDPKSIPIWAAGCYGVGALVNYNIGGGVFRTYLQAGDIGIQGQTRDEPTKAHAGQPAGRPNPWQLITVTDKTGGNVNLPSYDPLAAYAVGDYVSVQADIGPYYMSLVSAANHKANDLQDKTKWVLLTSSPNVSPPWKDNVNYPLGTLVYLSDLATPAKNGLYVQVNPAGTIRLGGGAFDKPGDANQTSWLKFDSITYQGNYNPAGVYNFGDYVSPGATYQGKIHVEKYNESNFFILGIPVQLV